MIISKINDWLTLIANADVFAKLIDLLLVNAQPDDTYKRMATWANH